MELGMLLPGIKVNTGPNDFAPVSQMRMQRFNGESWELFGPVMPAISTAEYHRAPSGLQSGERHEHGARLLLTRTLRSNACSSKPASSAASRDD